MLADHIAYVALVSNDPTTAAKVFERHFGLPRGELSSPAGPVPVFALGRSALAVFPPAHPLVEGEARPGVHHIALGVDDVDAAGLPVDSAKEVGLGGRRIRRLPRETMNGVRIVLTERLGLTPSGTGPVERLDHLGVASTDVGEDEELFSEKLGFAVESRQTDIEVSMPMESFTSDKYGVLYHTRAPELRAACA